MSDGPEGVASRPAGTDLDGAERKHMSRVERRLREVALRRGDWVADAGDVADLLAEYNRQGAERDEARAEVERLRGRTHEIQAEEMARRAALDSEIAMWRQRWDLARQWSEDAELKAAWAADPTRAWWSMTSERDRAVLMRLVAESGMPWPPSRRGGGTSWNG